MGTNREAVARVVEALRSTDAIEEVHEGLVRLTEGLAVAVDEAPGNAALWREYRTALLQLETVGSGGVDDGYATLTLEVRRTQVVDAIDAGPGDPGPGRGRSRKGDGAAADAVAEVGRRRRT